MVKKRGLAANPNKSGARGKVAESETDVIDYKKMLMEQALQRDIDASKKMNLGGIALAETIETALRLAYMDIKNKQN